MKFLLSMIPLILTVNSAVAQEKPLLAKELTFKSIFATTPEDSLNIYCLLGSGFFRTPRSKNSDSLITEWLIQHPKAIVVPVVAHGPTMTAQENSLMTYCWLIDGKDTINNFLIKQGCFPGGTMMKPPKKIKMSSREKSLMKKMPNQPKRRYFNYISEKKYEAFLEQIKVAEASAKSEKLGIWVDME